MSPADWLPMLSDPLALAASLAVGATVALIILALFGSQEEVQTGEHRQFAVAVGKGERDTLFEQTAFAPMINLALAVARRLNTPDLRKRIRRDLAVSGNPSGYSVDEYLAICLLTCVGLGIAGGVMAYLVELGTGVMVGLIFLGIGFYLPLYTLRDAADSRLIRIAKELPYKLDLISLMLGAGSSFAEAVQTVIRDNPDEDLNQEFRIVLTEMDFGTPRTQALRNMADRLDLESLRSIVAAITQSEKLGTPLTNILDAQARMIRSQRAVLAEKKSASASLRLLLPGTLILLAVMLCMFGPVVLSVMREGWF